MNDGAAPLVLALTLTVSGCLVGPDYRVPDAELPPAYAEAGPQTSAGSSETRWWTAFGDAELDSLIDRAALANLDLALAQARVREARADRSAAASALYPSLDASASYRRRDQSDNLSSSASGKGFEQGPDLFDAAFDAAWEIDVFGGVRRSVQAADAELEAVAFDRDDVLLSLIGEVARNYIEVRSYQRQLDVARTNLDTQKQTRDLTRARFQGGLVSEFDVAGAEAQVATTTSDLPLLESGYKRSVHRLGVLLGQAPGSLDAELAESGAVPVSEAALPLGLPSDLLRRRPDVRADERRLASATARVGVATADLFPKFSLIGSGGLQSVSAKDFFTAGSGLWSVGPTITWPIFRGGQIRATIEARGAQEEQALIRYRQTVLDALEEVENAIVDYDRERQRQRALEAAVASNTRAVELARQIYLRGLTDLRDLLDSQRRLFATQTALARSQASVSENLVALHKALGGGWESGMPPDRATKAGPDLIAAR